MRKIISIILSFGLLFQQSGLLYAAGEINLANYLSQAKSAIVQPDQFRPAQLRYISYDIKSNDFKLLLDKGGAKLNELSNSLNSSTPKLNDATQELFNYFLIGLSLPNDTFWVNLRPDAPENIIDPLLEKTDIGKIFLEADLQLKKDTASLTSPQNPEGKSYWDKLYKKAGELFGTENITIPTITRPWIVPNEVIVRETEDSAYIYKATLKVMLEADYLKSSKQSAVSSQQSNFSDPRLKELNEYSSQIIRETIIPKLTKEINSSKRYAQLRQVYYSLVLARWFKQKYSSLGSIGASANSYLGLIDSGNLANLASPESCDKQAYFQAYQKSFKDGEYNLKETVATPFGQSIRSYISGGLGMGFPYKAVNSPVAGLKVNSSSVTDILTEQQPPATTGSPLTLEQINKKIKELKNYIANNQFRIEEIQYNISDYNRKIKNIENKISKAENYQPDELYKKKRELEEQKERNYLAIYKINNHSSKMRGELNKLIEEAVKFAASPLTAMQFEIIVQHIFSSSDSFEVKAASIVKYWLTLKSGEEKKSIYSGNIREIFGKFINLGGFRGGDATINYIMEFIESKLRANKEYLSDQWNNEVFASVIFHSNSKENNEQIEISKRLQEALNAKSLEDAEAIVEKLIKDYPGSELAFSNNDNKAILARIIPIEMLLSLFMKHAEQQETLNKSLGDVIEDARASILGDKTDFNRVATPEDVKFGVRNILRKIWEIGENNKNNKDETTPITINKESLKAAVKVFKIVSQEDKEYPYRELVGSYIKPVFEEFLKKKADSFNVTDIQSVIEEVFSNYISNDAIRFLEGFIRNSYVNVPSRAQVLNKLSTDLGEAQQNVFRVKPDRYDMGNILSIIESLQQFSNFNGLETAKENLLLIQEVTAAGSPLTDRINLAISTFRYNFDKSWGDFSALDEIDKVWKKEIQDMVSEFNRGVNKIIDKIAADIIKNQNPLVAVRENIFDLEKIFKYFNSKMDEVLKHKPEPKPAYPPDRNIFERVFTAILPDWRFFVNHNKYTADSRSRIFEAYPPLLVRFKKDFVVLLETLRSINNQVSSAIGSEVIVPVVKHGGIDLTDRMLKIKLERVGSFASSSLALPEITNLEALDLDKEYERIQAMDSSSIRPSDTRILEFAAACYYRGEFDRRLAQVSSCIKSAHLADELLGKESSPALRLATMLPDALYGDRRI